MKYFKLEEFKCKCGCGSAIMDEKFLDKLDKARGIAGIPFVVNSGYRCEAHNRAVGGKSESAHTKGLAVDIKASTSATRFRVLSALMAVGFNRVGVASGFVHADDDPSLPQDVLWVY